NRRETLRIRTPLPGPRGEAKWLRTRYAVECQSSYERGAARDFSSPGVCFLRCHQVWPGAPVRRDRKGGTRWTLIVRAEVGPPRCCPTLFRAHAAPSEIPLYSSPCPAPGR